MINGSIDNTNIASGAAIGISKLAGYPSDNTKFLRGDGTWAVPSGGGGAAPTGAVTEYAGSSAPTGWLLCDGSAVSRSTYAALFAVIGTNYGAGDGSTTFNVPDVRGRVPTGKGSHADVDVLGDNDGSVLADRRPKHKHTDPWGTQGLNNATGGPDFTIPRLSASTNGLQVGPQTNAPTDGPAYVVFNYIIAT